MDQHEGWGSASEDEEERDGEENHGEQQDEDEDEETDDAPEHESSRYVPMVTGMKTRSTAGRNALW